LGGSSSICVFNRNRLMARGADELAAKWPGLDFGGLSVKTYAMTVVTRTFLRRFAQYKRTAEAGKTITVIDRRGRRFLFQAEKPRRLHGAAAHMSDGMAVSPDPIPASEWKGLR
jgi:predicted protein tyrosine phosphatase